MSNSFKCVKCQNTDRITQYGICLDCIQIAHKEQKCANCGKPELYQSSPFCYYCLNIWRQAFTGHHERVFTEKSKFRKYADCTYCSKTKPVFANSAQICSDCSANIKRENYGWCGRCRKKLVYESPYCKNCLSEMKRERLPTLCVQCGQRPIAVQKALLCGSCYRRHITINELGNTVEYINSLSQYLEQSKIVFFSRKLLNRWCRSEHLPEKKRRLIPYLFNLESNGYKLLRRVFPDEIFAEVLCRFEGAVCINWEKYNRLLAHHYLRRRV